jgi:hypothetical protein
MNIYFMMVAFLGKEVILYIMALLATGTIQDMA